MSERHVRQERLPQIGAAGQECLRRARVAIVGVGATGSHLAETLTRTGVGMLRLIDRDVVELSNLPRQVLFTTADADEVRPKAVAAAEALARIDPDVMIEPVVADLVADDAPRLLGDVDLVLDGTDNFPTRMLVNDLCVRDGIPFVYCGVVATEGQVLVIRPGGPCLRCYVPDVPAPGSLPTCDTAGVLGSAVAMVASLSATEAIKILLGSDAVNAGRVLVVDAWGGTVRALELVVDPECPCCVRGEHPFLESAAAPLPTELCGRDAVQLPPTRAAVDLPSVAQRLATLGEVRLTPVLLRLDLPERRVLLFADGRMIVGGTKDAAQARTVRAQLLGD